MNLFEITEILITILIIVFKRNHINKVVVRNQQEKIESDDENQTEIKVLCSQMQAFSFKIENLMLRVNSIEKQRYEILPQHINSSDISSDKDSSVS